MLRGVRPRRSACLTWLVLLALLPARGGARRPPQEPAAPSSPAPPAAAPAVVVLDPAHGGTDAGARGPRGLLEKDVVLALARALRDELRRRGLEVVLTREGGENPSFDDRSMAANAQRGAIFLTLHIASGGPIGTARAFYLPPAKPVETAPAPPAPALVRWEDAQSAYAERSRRLAELVQAQLAQKFRGSPEAPTAAAVRQLRTVACPAAAVEVASVAAPNSRLLEELAPQLGAAIGQAVEAFRSLPGSRGN